MFLIECPHCQRRELRGYRGIRSFTNTGNGITLSADCTNCGHPVTMLTGRPTRPGTDAGTTTVAGQQTTEAPTATAA